MPVNPFIGGNSVGQGLVAGAGNPGLAAYNPNYIQNAPQWYAQQGYGNLGDFAPTFDALAAAWPAPTMGETLDNYIARIWRMAFEERPDGGKGTIPSGYDYAIRPRAQALWSAKVQAPPLPHQVNPAVWDALGPVGQQLTLGAAESLGFDADEYLRQLNAARPVGNAPRSTRVQYAEPRGLY